MINWQIFTIYTLDYIIGLYILLNKLSINKNIKVVARLQAPGNVFGYFLCILDLHLSSVILYIFIIIIYVSVGISTRRT